MMYLTYEEYTTMGGTLSETAFNNIEFQAETYIDWYTFNRLHGETELPERVKRCMYAIIDLLANKDAMLAQLTGASAMFGDTVPQSIASQSNDGVSISYNVLPATDLMDNTTKEIEDTINKALQGVTNSLGRKLLYRGLYEYE